ncbi:kanadaptin [Hetaerina americana]|uniref:kanadaptin n=1 Tax=Hetaerina americana TaxID=62018 RepID=UPI003A7F1485
MEEGTSNEAESVSTQQDPNVETVSLSSNKQLEGKKAGVLPVSSEPPNDLIKTRNERMSDISDGDGSTSAIGDQNVGQSVDSDASRKNSMEPESENHDANDKHDALMEPFKKPLTLASKGKPGKVPPSELPHDARNDSEQIGTNEEKKRKSSTLPTSKRDNSVPIPYREPSWSSLLEEPYSLEVLKSGSIIETIDLSSKPFFVFGRQSNCDVQLGHPTISRHHAVLQHKAKSDTSSEDDRSTFKDAGLYVYDLGSTHGTFVNKHMLPKQRYIRLNVGHMLKFGGSTRSYIVIGPKSDVEAESDKSITELKEEAMRKKLKRLEDQMTSDMKPVEEEDQGVDWGLGEDADEESDMSENPFAATQNEELYLDDPKKTLRGWFEREGEELEYEVDEKSFGQFLCQVRLPVDDARGKPLVAEALVKGKKKEAVVQCALEACRILDRMGLLRQATHESKKRKARNWEEDDFYDSDEDTFLDRTGTVERKREKRMLTAGKLKTKTETYESLLEKHQEIMDKIKDTQRALDNERTGKSKSSKEKKSEEDEADTLDAYMSTLTDKSALDKVNFRRLKVDLAELQQEEAQISKLIEIARPVNMPGIPSTNVVSVKSEQDDATKVVEETMEDQPKNSSPSSPKEIPLSTREEKIKVENEMVKQSSEKPVEIVTRKPLVEHVEGENDGECTKVESVEAKKTGIKRQMVALTPPDECKKEKISEEKAETHGKSESNKSAKSSGKEVVMDEDYSMWVPPDNQTGDGRTKLNEKYGY